MLLLAAHTVICVGTTFAADGHARHGTLTVLATGFRNETGHILVQLADSQADYDEDEKAFRMATVPIEGTQATIVFDDLPYGEYAVKLFHDENDNRKLDFGLMGPKESYGFSNNVMGTFGPPTWKKAKLDLAAPSLTIKIETR